jgi:hypothetical protein
VGREGIEPPNGVAELIYSQRPLATWISARMNALGAQSRQSESNRRHFAYKANALPTELCRRGCSCPKHASRAMTSSPLWRNYTIRVIPVKMRFGASGRELYS